MESNISYADVAAMTRGDDLQTQWNNPFMYLIWLALLGGNGNGLFGRGGGSPQVAQLQSTIDQNHNNDMALGAISNGTDATRSVAAAVDALRSQMQTCCCENKTLTQQMGYESQLRDQANSAATIQRIDALANGVQQGFSSIGYQMAQDKCDIVQSGTANTQRIIDALNTHWTSDLSQKYQDAKLELSQLNQNATLIAALKTTA